MVDLNLSLRVSWALVLTLSSSRAHHIARSNFTVEFFFIVVLLFIFFSFFGFCFVLLCFDYSFAK